MAEFERTTTVGIGADAAFAVLADPARLPQYAPTVTHVETTVVDGAAEEEANARTSPGIPEARFFADRAGRRVEWVVPNADYEGAVVVDVGTASTSQVTIRLRTRDDGGHPHLERMLEDTVRNLRRLLSRR